MIGLSNISKHYGSKVLYANASLQINPGEKIGLVGPNGAGKTTIFRVITGEEGVDDGYVSVPNKLRIAYFSQNIAEMEGRSALAEVMSADPDITKISARLKVFEQKLEDSAVNAISDDAMTKLLEEYGEAQAEFEQRGGYTLESRAQEIL